MIVFTQIESTDAAGTATVLVTITPAYAVGGFPINYSEIPSLASDAAFSLARDIPQESLYNYWSLKGSGSRVPTGINMIEFSFEYEQVTEDFGPAL